MGLIGSSEMRQVDFFQKSTPLNLHYLHNHLHISLYHVRSEVDVIMPSFWLNFGLTVPTLRYLIGVLNLVLDFEWFRFARKV